MKLIMVTAAITLAMMPANICSGPAPHGAPPPCQCPSPSPWPRRWLLGPMCSGIEIPQSHRGIRLCHSPKSLPFPFPGGHLNGVRKGHKESHFSSGPLCHQMSCNFFFFFLRGESDFKMVWGFRIADNYLLPFDSQGNRGPERLSNVLRVSVQRFQHGW